MMPHWLSVRGFWLLKSIKWHCGLPSSSNPQRKSAPAVICVKGPTKGFWAAPSRQHTASPSFRNAHFGVSNGPEAMAM